MKKLLVVLSLTMLLVLIVGTSVLANSTVKLSYDLAGNADFKSSGTSLWKPDIESGTSLGYEYTVESKQLEYGAGIEYQLAEQ